MRDNGFYDKKEIRAIEWDIATEPWHYCSGRTVLFNWLDRKKPSEMDEIELSEWEAVKLYQLGKEHPVAHADIALPVFSIHFYVIEYSGKIYKMIQPKQPYRSHYSFGLYCDFVAVNNTIIISVSVDDSTDSSAGIIDVGVLGLKKNAFGRYEVQPCSINQETVKIMDRLALTRTAKWLGRFFDGVQYQIRFKPEQVSIRHEKVSKEDRDRKKSSKNKVRVVKVRRVISFKLDEEGVVNRDALPDERTERIRRSYTLPCWGVCGHFRHYKSGKVVWVHPYKKGKDRDKEGVYCGKQYQFVKEVSQG